MIRWLPLILVGVILNAAAQIALKYAAGGLSKTPLELSNAGEIARHTLTNLAFWIAVVLYGISVFNWVIVLSRVDVSASYPLLSVGYIIVAVYGSLAFGEAMTAWRIAGIALICGGTACIFRN